RRRSRRAGRGLLPGSRRRLLRRRDRPAGARFEHDDRGDQRTAGVAAARPGRGLGGGGRATRQRAPDRVAAARPEKRTAALEGGSSGEPESIPGRAGPALRRFPRRVAAPAAAPGPRYWTVIVPCMPVGGVPLNP